MLRYPDDGCQETCLYLAARHRLGASRSAALAATPEVPSMPTVIVYHDIVKGSSHRVLRTELRPALRRSRSTALNLMFDPYRMSIPLSTAAASRNARRSAPSRVRYSFRRPAS